MKKKLILILVIVAVMSLSIFTACEPEEQAPTPIQSEGSTTIIESTDKTPTEIDVKSGAYVVAGKLKNLQSYQKDTVGSTGANKSFINYTQNIENVSIKLNDEYFSESKSNSLLVSVTHQSFTKNGKVVYRDSTDGEMNVANAADYADVYGVVPNTPDIEGFVFNDESILSAERYEEDGLTVFSYTLDSVKATEKMKKQMKIFGGLSDYPSFSSLSVQIFVDKDWNPVRILSNSKYTIMIPILGEMDCEQSLRSTFSSINGNVSIPDAESFNNKIGSTPSEVNPIDPTSAAWKEVGDKLTSLNWDGGISLSLNLDVNLAMDMGFMMYPMQLSLPVDVSVKTQSASTNIKEALMLKVRVALPNGDDGNMIGSTIAQLLPANAAFLDLYYTGDGNVYTVFVRKVGNVETPAIVKTQSIASLLGETVLDLLLSGDTQQSLSVVSQVIGGFNADKNDDGITFSANEDTVGIVNELYQTLVVALGGILDADTGEMIAGILQGDITAVDLEVKYATDGSLKSMEIKLDGTMIPTDDEKPNFSIRLDVNGVADSKNFDNDEYLKKLVADFEIATAVFDEIAIFTSQDSDGNYKYFWLGDSFVARWNALNNKYMELTDDQKAIVYNYADFKEMLDYHNSMIATLETFKTDYASLNKTDANAWDKLQRSFNRFSLTAKEYLGSAFLEEYANARNAFEESFKANLIAEINEMKASSDKLTTVEEFITLLRALNNKIADKSSLTSDRQAEVDVVYSAAREYVSQKADPILLAEAKRVTALMSQYIEAGNAGNKPEKADVDKCFADYSNINICYNIMAIKTTELDEAVTAMKGLIGDFRALMQTY